jgi:hypothetical protein
MTSQFSAITDQIKTGNAALDQFIKTLAEAAFQAALFGKGPLAGLFGGGLGGGGGGLLGSGLAGLFGGFFAEGGNLGAGKWGIAGEAGPEIIKGPATVVPINKMQSGGAAVVNVSIDATGASSAELARTQQELRNLKESLPRQIVAVQRQAGVGRAI